MTVYNGPYFDVDVHHRLPVDTDILEYLPSEWRDYAVGEGRGFHVVPPYADGVLFRGLTKRSDAYGDDGSPPACRYEMVRDGLLDAHGTDYRAILTHQLGEYGGHFNQYFSRVLSSATNDWTIEEWLKKDERLFGALVIPLAEPEEAAKEIRRLGSHPQMIGVLIAGNILGRPLGDPLYHPIFEASEEMGLQIICHLSPLGAPHRGVVAAGGRLNFLPMITQVSQQAMHYVSSLITHGVFERFPNVKVIMTEYGIGWVPYAAWQLDAQYEILKRESPWIKRLPSEYIRDHVRFSTQPLEEDLGDRDALFDLLGALDWIEDVICFSTDYPHMTMDLPEYVARRLPESWREKVLHENATKLFGLPSLRASGAAAVPAPVSG